jgi:hypothetical protein
MTGMVDDNKQPVTAAEPSTNQAPPPPRFDAHASASAQPVQPLTLIRGSGPARWLQRARHVQQAITTRTKTLVIVVVAGLVLGAASGALLARRNDPASRKAVIEESGIETAAAGQAIEKTPADTSGEDRAMDLGHTIQTERIRRHRYSPRRGALRAYRFAVIK